MRQVTRRLLFWVEQGPVQMREWGWANTYVIDYHEAAGTYRGRFHHAETKAQTYSRSTVLLVSRTVTRVLALITYICEDVIIS
jgi:hypothetical protein